MEYVPLNVHSANGLVTPTRQTVGGRSVQYW